MDQISDLPPMTTHPADQFADPSPPMTTSNAHPPYAEMIIAAITALKDKDGSSRQAISKYIEKEFTNLPPTHATLLTHFLKRLKTEGQLVMVKHSYMLPPARSAQLLPPGYHTTTTTLDFTGNNVNFNVTDAANSNANAGATAAVVGVNFENSTKRKPGRPPKLKPVPGLGLGAQVQHQMPNVQPFDASAAGVPSYQPQFQNLQANYGSGPDFQGNSGGGSEPLFASLGLGDDGAAIQSPPVTENTTVVVKRGRGRPPKNGGGSGGQVVVSGGGTIEGDVAGQIEGGERLLRKPKMMSVMMGGGNGVRVKRGRGRPRRIGIGPVTVPLSGNVLRPRGRPKRIVRSNVTAVNVNGGGVGEIGFKRRPGRPSVNKIARFTGKPLGRPSKNGPGTAVLVTDPRQLVVYQELKTKYELLQSKVKQVASVVKTCIDPEYGNTALGALQELEALAGEVNPLSHGQTQEPTQN